MEMLVVAVPHESIDIAGAVRPIQQASAPLIEPLATGAKAKPAEALAVRSLGSATDGVPYPIHPIYPAFPSRPKTMPIEPE
jgi:hypothetical protein